MNNIKRRKKTVSIWLGITLFILSVLVGGATKVMMKPSWQSNYSVKWSEDLGTKIVDLKYGENESNKYDLYLPKDNSRKSYGLVIYLHAGGFTTGDKKDDEDMLSWLTKKGYVAAGINYTLRTASNNSSLKLQSDEIKQAIPKVIEEAKRRGYDINKMTVAGGSAGHALAMIYTYRDGKDAPVPVVLTFGAVGPASFVREDWGIFGLDKDTEESINATAGLFGLMAGEKISIDEIKDGSYLEKMKPISAADWVSNNPVPAVVAYGTHDKMQPYLASLRLKKALEDNQVDYKFYEMPHSGHGLQNDSDISKQWMESIDEYLDKYMPVK
ncbi:alpha/beta hydrolase [Aerococcus sp. L_32]|uniref:alpha/beta hydrolase n=1 Tax=Aerococcus sp. L_32 TaxID=3422316 RepID=UPI003D6A38DA